jgi:hypothetical protein
LGLPKDYLLNVGLLSKGQRPNFPQQQARPLLRCHSYPRFCHSVREADIPLDSLARCSGSTPHGSPSDARSMTVDAHPPPPNSSAPTFDHNGELPTSPFPVSWTSENTGLSPDLSKAGPSHITLGNLTSATSRFIGGTEVPQSGTYHSSSFPNLELQFDDDNGMHASGGLTASMSWGADNPSESAAERRSDTASHACHPDAGSCAPVDQRDAEPLCVDGPTTLDPQHFPVHTCTNRSAFGVLSFPGTRGADYRLSCSAPAYTWQPTTDPASPPLFSPIHPSSLELAHTNSISPPCQTAPLTDPPNTASGCAPLVPPGCKDPHLLPPPPEVAVLLTAQTAGDVVSTVFARNSPLIPWELPSEIEYFWLGLFKISEVKVTHACHFQTTGLILLWVCLFVRWKRVRGEATQTP